MNIAITAEIKEDKNLSYAVVKGNTKKECAEEKTLLEERYMPSKEGLEALENSKKSEENVQGKDQLKAMKIARNIMRGKIVPPQDEQYLIEFDAKLYQVAKSIGAMKEQTEKIKSELEEEENVTQEKLNALMQEAGMQVLESGVEAETADNADC